VKSFAGLSCAYILKEHKAFWIELIKPIFRLTDLVLLMPYLGDVNFRHAQELLFQFKT
jgi:hypothetical protein